MTKKLSVGGQAVIEGVMMKGPEKMAVAVRQANGEIAVDVKPVSSIRDRYPFFKKPFLRGVVSLVESLVDGMKALSYSAPVGTTTNKRTARRTLTAMVRAISLSSSFSSSSPDIWAE